MASHRSPRARARAVAYPRAFHSATQLTILGMDLPRSFHEWHVNPQTNNARPGRDLPAGRQGHCANSRELYADSA